MAREVLWEQMSLRITPRAPRITTTRSLRNRKWQKKNDWFERFNLKPVLLNFGVFSCYLANDKRVDKTVKELFKIHFFRCVWTFHVAPYFRFRKVMQGLFSVLETELHSYIHFADRLDNL